MYYLIGDLWRAERRRIGTEQLNVDRATGQLAEASADLHSPGKDL